MNSNYSILILIHLIILCETEAMYSEFIDSNFGEQASVVLIKLNRLDNEQCKIAKYVLTESVKSWIRRKC